MSKQTHIPVHQGPLYNINVQKYPTWMKFALLDDDLGKFISVISTLSVHAIEKRINDFYDSYGSTADTAPKYSHYYISRDTDFTYDSLISGDYTTGIGYVGSTVIQQVNSIAEFYTSDPTRFTFEAQNTIDTSITTSGMALCYTEVSPVSGIYYVSFAADPTLYTMNEDYKIVASGNYQRYLVDEELEFSPLSGDLYVATLSHTPATSVQFYDIYSEGTTVSGITLSSTSVFSQGEQINWFGRLRAKYSYDDFTEIARVSTGKVIHSINQWEGVPAFVCDETVETFVPLDSNTHVTGYRSFAVDPTIVVPGETVEITFGYDLYQIQSETLSGTYEYSIAATDSVHLDSVRIISQSATDNLVYYDSGTTYLSNVNPGSYDTYGNVPSDDFTVEGTSSKLLIRNYTAIAGPFKIVYYVRRERTNTVESYQSYAADIEGGFVRKPDYYKDYTWNKSGMLVPKTIIAPIETASSIVSQFLTMPIDRFSFAVRRWRKGICYDPFFKNYWILENNDVVYNLANKKRYYIPRYLEDPRYTYVCDIVHHDGWSDGTGYYYKRVDLENYYPEARYLITGMTLWGAYLCFYAFKDQKSYIILSSRFDPSQVLVYQIYGDLPL